MNKKLIQKLEDYMWEQLADYYAPLTDDLLVEAMEDGEKVQVAFDIMINRIGKHFKDLYGIETFEDILSDPKYKDI